MGSLDLTIITAERIEMREITVQVRAALAEARFESGICLIYVPHTTAGITINENADPDVAADLLTALAQTVPAGIAWRHREGNSPAHLQAVLVGSSVSLAVRAGRPLLGRWQGIFFCEFDGPRRRTVQLTLVPAGVREK
jgi:secondary thiamine-phosphate synthase enzyme